MPRDLALASQDASRPAYEDLSLEEVVRLKIKEYFRQTGNAQPGNLYDVILERVERPLLELTLERTNGNQLQAAAILGINRNTLRKKLNLLKVTPRRAPASDS
jgi:Fis family transcriptional regulator